MSWQAWLPTIVRSDPSELISLTYCAAPPPPAHSEGIVLEALRAAHLSGVRGTAAEWHGSLPWRTLVYGAIRRDVDEELSLTLGRSEEGWELRLRCEPRATHGAHAAGAAGVVMIAATVWVATGWIAGVIPGLTTLVAGGLWADATRVMAMTRLEGRLRRLIEDLGFALWPGVPAQVLPRPATLGRS